jgi:hypothetical protein
MSMRVLSADVVVLVDRNATVADAALSYGGGDDPVITATGSSKREQGDVTDDEIAVSLAVGRALEKLGRDLRRRGEAQVKAACDVAEAKRVKAEAKRVAAEARRISDMEKKEIAKVNPLVALVTAIRGSL